MFSVYSTVSDAKKHLKSAAVHFDEVANAKMLLHVGRLHVLETFARIRRIGHFVLFSLPRLRFRELRAPHRNMQVCVREPSERTEPGRHCGGAAV